MNLELVQLVDAALERRLCRGLKALKAAGFTLAIDRVEFCEQLAVQQADGRPRFVAKSQGILGQELVDLLVDVRQRISAQAMLGAQGHDVARAVLVGLEPAAEGAGGRRALVLDPDVAALAVGETVDFDPGDGRLDRGVRALHVLVGGFHQQELGNVVFAVQQEVLLLGLEVGKAVDARQEACTCAGLAEPVAVDAHVAGIDQRDDLFVGEVFVQFNAVSLAGQHVSDGVARDDAAFGVVQGDAIVLADVDLRHGSSPKKGRAGSMPSAGAADAHLRNDACGRWEGWRRLGGDRTDRANQRVVGDTFLRIRRLEHATHDEANDRAEAHGAEAACLDQIGDAHRTR